MQPLVAFLAEHPVLLLTVLLALGSLLGTVRVKGVNLGPAAVLFSAIAVSSLGAANGTPLRIPEVVGTLGLVLFTYTMGIISGPSFFASLRRGWAPITLVVLAFAGVAVLAAVAGRLLGLSAPVVAGTFAGALTNTPALAAASERAGDATGPTIGYSIAYLFGVIGMIVSSLLVLRRGEEDSDRPQPLTQRTVRIDREDVTRVSDIVRAHNGTVAFSRMRHGESSPLFVVGDDALLQHDDLVTVVGTPDAVDAVVRELGHVSSHSLQAERGDVDYRRITVSNPRLAGRTVGELDLEDRYGAHATRLRRGDQDLLASDELVVQMGDRLRVTAPTARMPQVSAYLGDSERGLSDINPLGFALGLALGVAIGVVAVPLPGGAFSLGEAAGTLLVGLVFGRLVRIGPLVVSMGHAAATSLSTFGMITFLAYAGSRAGERFVAAVASDLGWKVFLLGAVLTTALAAALAVVGRRVLRTGPRQLAGILGGANTQPAVLAFANERTGFDVRVGLGYALVYPAAMITKILLAQILAGL